MVSKLKGHRTKLFPIQTFIMYMALLKHRQNSHMILSIDGINIRHINHSSRHSLFGLYKAVETKMTFIFEKVTIKK